MAFKDTYTAPEFSGSFIKADEKDALIRDATVFDITGVRLIPNGSYDGKADQYVVSLTLDGEERALGFTAGSVWTRDDLFDNLGEYFKGDDAEPVPAFMKREKQTVLVDVDV
jgi:hypothetical protein